MYRCLYPACSSSLPGQAPSPVPVTLPSRAQTALMHRLLNARVWWINNAVKSAHDRAACTNCAVLRWQSGGGIQNPPRQPSQQGVHVWCCLFDVQCALLECETASQRQAAMPGVTGKQGNKENGDGKHAPLGGLATLFTEGNSAIATHRCIPDCYGTCYLIRHSLDALVQGPMPYDAGLKIYSSSSRVGISRMMSRPSSKAGCVWSHWLCTSNNAMISLLNNNG